MNIGAFYIRTNEDSVMSDGPVRISRKEFSSDEILSRLDDGQRVIVTTGAFGIEKEITLRKNEDTYVCDTGFKLMSYDDRDGMKQCIERLRLADPDSDE